MGDDRKQGIGGSDAAAAVGLNPWKTPLELYMEKTGEADPPDLTDNDAVHFGTVLEDVVAQEFSRRTGWKTARVNDELVHKDHAFARAHIDRRIVAKNEILECKTAGIRQAQLWGDEETDEIPIHYGIQAQHYLAVTRADMCHIAVLIAGSEFRIYRVARDDELIAALLKKEAIFWRHVEKRDPPPPITLADATVRWPQHVDAKTIAPMEGSTLYERISLLRIARANVAAEEARAEALELEIKTAMADASAILGPDGKPLVTWRTQTANVLDQKALTAAHPEIVGAFRKDRESRVFRLTKAKG